MTGAAAGFSNALVDVTHERLESFVGVNLVDLCGGVFGEQCGVVGKMVIDERKRGADRMFSVGCNEGLVILVAVDLPYHVIAGENAAKDFV